MPVLRTKTAPSASPAADASAPAGANDPASDTIAAATAEVAAIEREARLMAAPQEPEPQPTMAEAPAAPESSGTPSTPADAEAPDADAADDHAPAAPQPRYILPMAAAIVLAAGLGWGGGLLWRPAQPTNETMRLAQALEGLTADVAALKDAAALAATAKPASVSLGPVLSRLDVLTETTDRARRDLQDKIAGLPDKIGIDKGVGERLAPLMARLDRIEKSLTTGSVAAVTTPAVAGAQPLPPMPAEVTPAKLPGYVLREVDDGIAVIEDRRGGLYELMRGETLPGVGRIQKIERRAGAWVVVTDKGLIDAR